MICSRGGFGRRDGRAGAVGEARAAPVRDRRRRFDIRRGRAWGLEAACHHPAHRRMPAAEFSGCGVCAFPIVPISAAVKLEEIIPASNSSTLVTLFHALKAPGANLRFAWLAGLPAAASRPRHESEARAVGIIPCGRFSGRRYRFSMPQAPAKPPVCLARRTSAAAFAASARVKDSCRWYQPLPRLPAIGCFEATPIGAPGRELDRILPVSALRARQAHLARRNRPRRRPQQGRTRRLTVSKGLKLWWGGLEGQRLSNPPADAADHRDGLADTRKPGANLRSPGFAGPSAGRMHGLGVSRRLTPLASGLMRGRRSVMGRAASRPSGIAAHVRRIGRGVHREVGQALHAVQFSPSMRSRRVGPSRRGECSTPGS